MIPGEIELLPHIRERRVPRTLTPPPPPQTTQPHPHFASNPRPAPKIFRNCTEQHIPPSNNRILVCRGYSRQQKFPARNTQVPLGHILQKQVGGGSLYLCATKRRISILIDISTCRKFHYIRARAREGLIVGHPLGFAGIITWINQNYYYIWCIYCYRRKNVCIIIYAHEN